MPQYRQLFLQKLENSSTPCTQVLFPTAFSLSSSASLRKIVLSSHCAERSLHIASIERLPCWTSDRASQKSMQSSLAANFKINQLDATADDVGSQPLSLRRRLAYARQQLFLLLLGEPGMAEYALLEKAVGVRMLLRGALVFRIAPALLAEVFPPCIEYLQLYLFTHGNTPFE